MLQQDFNSPKQLSKALADIWNNYNCVYYICLQLVIAVDAFVITHCAPISITQLI